MIDHDSDAPLRRLLAASLPQLRRSPQKTEAYFALAEAPPAIVPLLIETFHAETAPSARALLVDAVWEHRLPASLPFLVEALEDADPQVWKNALDGFVAVGHPEALLRLREVRTRWSALPSPDPERLAWLDETVQQLAEDLA